MQNLILCGFMGCGKTTVGQLLAKKLNTDFFDVDHCVETKAGMLVFEIFDLLGEASFRRLEAEAVQELSQRRGVVVACGGGTVLDPKNVQCFKKTGRIILLDAPLSVISRRLQGDHSRPLLNRADRDRAMQQLYLARMPVYRAAADLTINVGEKTPDEAADEILRQSKSN